MALLAAVQAENSQVLFPTEDSVASHTGLIILADHRMVRRKRRRRITRWPFPLDEAETSALLSPASKRLLAEEHWTAEPVMLNTFLDVIADREAAVETDSGADADNRLADDDTTSDLDDEAISDLDDGATSDLYDEATSDLSHGAALDLDEFPSSDLESDSFIVGEESEEDLPPSPQVTIDQSPLLYQALQETIIAAEDVEKRAKCQVALRHLSDILNDAYALITSIEHDRPLNWRSMLSLARLGRIDPAVLERCERRLARIFPSE